jgi:hypothetical protein
MQLTTYYKPEKVSDAIFHALYRGDRTGAFPFWDGTRIEFTRLAPKGNHRYRIVIRQMSTPDERGKRRMIVGSFAGANQPIFAIRTAFSLIYNEIRGR